MKPGAIDRLAIVVEDKLATIVIPVDGPRCAVRELAFAELHSPQGLYRAARSGLGVLVQEHQDQTLAVSDRRRHNRVLPAFWARAFDLATFTKHRRGS
ncbi:MAG TPA: hypothetical protein VGP68_16030 [Gemmataceae bacterium]|nr:hypothetical protein [Gemmataceae bacterium]